MENQVTEVSTSKVENIKKIGKEIQLILKERKINPDSEYWDDFKVIEKILSLTSDDTEKLLSMISLGRSLQIEENISSSTEEDVNTNARILPEFFKLTKEESKEVETFLKEQADVIKDSLSPEEDNGGEFGRRLLSSIYSSLKGKQRQLALIYFGQRMTDSNPLEGLLAAMLGAKGKK